MKIPPKFWLLLPFLILLTASFSCQSLKKASKSVIPFSLTPQNNISIPTILNGNDTLDLMFHTAVSEVSLTEEAAGQIFEIDSQQSVTAQSWGGGGEAKYILNNQLTIGDFSWDSITVWVDKLSGQGTQGKFGPNLFKDKILEINFDTKEITVHAALPKSIKQDEYQRLKITYSRGIMFIEGALKIGDKTYPNQFMIHSGYGSTVLLDDQFSSENKIGEQLETISESELRDSYGNVLKTKKAMLPTFMLGEFEFNDIPISFFEGSIGRQQTSVLGSEILKRFNIILDQEKGFIYLKANGMMELGF